MYEDTNFYYLISEIHSPSTLADILLQNGKLKEQEVALIIYDLISLVSCLHTGQIVHRDLKLEGILYE
jgi:serine/threonine protein kinase